MGVVKFNDFIIVSPTNKYLRKLIFAALEQTAEISNISTRKNLQH